MSSTRAQDLLAIVDIITLTAHKLIDDWKVEDAASEPLDANASEFKLPSHGVYENSRTLIAASGSLNAAVVNPHGKLMATTLQYFEARSLHIATELDLPQVLASADPKVGMSINEIGKIVGVHPDKLGRILRTLCSTHIFREVTNNHFANNSASQVLVGNAPLRAYLSFLGGEFFTASDKLPETIRDPVKGFSSDVTDTSFQAAFGTKLSFWEWLEEGIEQPDGQITARPQLDAFSQAMLGGGRVTATPLYYDFPWASLANGTIVDVGGGVGGMSLELSKKYPNLNFVVQDLASVVSGARAVWSKDHPAAIDQKRVTFMPHNFFQVNPVREAEVYLLRYVLHDWEDDRCVDILKNIRPCLGPNSRVLIADQVMNTTVGCDELTSAPAPLLPNYGVYTRYAHCRDLNMMSHNNGVERTPEMFGELAKRAGLVVTKIWESRGIMSLTEMRIPSA